MKVFISYAREDGEFALRLATDLRAAGIDVWVDQLDIRPGDHWDRSVEEALKSCPVFLLVLSKAATASHNVMDELNYALEEGKKVVPALMEHCEPSFRLRRLQRVDFTQDYDVALQACADHLRQLFGSKIETRPQERPTQTRRSRTSWPGGTIATESPDRLDSVRILWVDDNPGNNRYERRTLEDLGAEVHLAIDTSDALLIVNEIDFDMILSDVGRPSGSQAGYDLLAALRRKKLLAPLIFFSSSNAPEHKRQAIESGATGATNNPHELVEMVLSTAKSIVR